MVTAVSGSLAGLPTGHVRSSVRVDVGGVVHREVVDPGGAHPLLTRPAGQGGGGLLLSGHSQRHYWQQDLTIRAGEYRGNPGMEWDKSVSVLSECFRHRFDVDGIDESLSLFLIEQ